MRDGLAWLTYNSNAVAGPYMLNFTISQGLRTQLRKQCPLLKKCGVVHPELLGNNLDLGIKAWPFGPNGKLYYRHATGTTSSHGSYLGVSKLLDSHSAFRRPKKIQVAIPFTVFAKLTMSSAIPLFSRFTSHQVAQAIVR